jgi:hypothetical protein
MALKRRQIQPRQLPDDYFVLHVDVTAQTTQSLYQSPAAAA